MQYNAVEWSTVQCNAVSFFLYQSLRVAIQLYLGLYGMLERFLQPLALMFSPPSLSISLTSYHPPSCLALPCLPCPTLSHPSPIIHPSPHSSLQFLSLSILLYPSLFILTPLSPFLNPLPLTSPLSQCSQYVVF